MPYHLTKPPTSSLAGTTASGVAVITGLGSTAALYIGQPVSGTGIPAGATVLTIDAADEVTLSVNATASGTVTLVFGVEPISLAEAKKHLSVFHSEDDDEIQALIVQAREDCESDTERSLLYTGWELILDEFPARYPYAPLSLETEWMPNGIISIRKPPVVSVGDITYDDRAGITQTLVSGVDFKVRHLGMRSTSARILPAAGRRWPSTLLEPGVIRVPFVAGYGATSADIPAILKAGMLMMVKHWWDNRSAVSEVGNTMTAIPLGVERCYRNEYWGARA